LGRHATGQNTTDENNPGQNATGQNATQKKTPGKNATQEMNVFFPCGILSRDILSVHHNDIPLSRIYNSMVHHAVVILRLTALSQVIRRQDRALTSKLTTGGEMSALALSTTKRAKPAYGDMSYTEAGKCPLLS